MSAVYEFRVPTPYGAEVRLSVAVLGGEVRLVLDELWPGDDHPLPADADYENRGIQLDPEQALNLGAQLENAAGQMLEETP